mmetsp:Transcript_98289/g.158498  ORF Transcript_98289/g.158498 Transcript_98289/m.158498 type:complete len:143 (-) Transcript_98289:13-441(-)
MRLNHHASAVWWKMNEKGLTGLVAKGCVAFFFWREVLVHACESPFTTSILGHRCHHSGRLHLDLRIRSLSLLRVGSLLKTDSGYPKDKGVKVFALATLKIPFVQLYHSPPSLIPGDRARGKRWGLAAATCHSQSARVNTDFQ